MTPIIEQSRPLTSGGVIELGDTFTDPAARRLFLRHENTTAVGHRQFSNVVLDTLSAMVFQDQAPVYCGGYRLPDELAQATRRLEGPADHRFRDRRVFMAYSKFNNYYHWMMECIPAIASYQTEPGFADAVLLLIAEGKITDDVVQAIRLATCHRRLPDLCTIGRQPLAIGELVISSCLQPQTAPSLFANQVFDRMASQIKRTSSPHRRFYVARSDSAQRRIINEAALIDLMIGYDIEPIVPGRLSQIEQIAAFRDATLVVGAHGAGLTNIAFMPPGGVVYEMFPSCFVRPCFNVLCQGRGIHYLADVFPCAGPARPTLEDHRKTSWQVDLGVVERRLAAIERSFDQG